MGGTQGTDFLREFELFTLPSLEPRTSARSETWSGTALPKVLTRQILLKCYVIQHFYRKRGPGTRFFTKSLKRRAPTAVARLVCVEMIASETQESCQSTFLENACFCANEVRFHRFCVSLMLILPNKRVDFTCFRVALVFHWHAFHRHRSLWCFTGYYFIDEERSHATWRSSCAAVYTLFGFVFAIFCSACLMSVFQ